LLERVEKFKNYLFAKSKSTRLSRLRILKAHRVHDTMALSVFKKKTVWRQQNYKFPSTQGETGTEIRNRNYFQARNNLVLFYSTKQSKNKSSNRCANTKVLLILYAFKKIGKTLLKQI
jgi:hypothetical protein